MVLIFVVAEIMIGKGEHNMIENKRKVGIVTIVDYTNYGNRLQNYAMQEIFKELGFSVETIKNHPHSGSDGYIKRQLKKVKRLLSTLKSRSEGVNLNHRKREFMKFTNSYIKESDFFVDSRTKNIDKINNYNGLVVGSDQIWNPNFRNHFFLDFLEGVSTSGIAVAASIGVSTLNFSNSDKYKKNLDNIKLISVREFAGADLINDLTGVTPKVVLDPTMILSKKQWLNVSKIHINKPTKPYILIYSLGGLSSSAQEFVRNINTKDEFDVVDLGTIRDLSYYDAGPSEFVDYINDASLLITDSFHGVAFSLILHTPFVIFNREDFKGELSMNSRIDTILSHFDLEERKLDHITYSNPFDMDFSRTDIILNEKKNDFNNFVSEGVVYFE